LIIPFFNWTRIFNNPFNCTNNCNYLNKTFKKKGNIMSNRRAQLRNDIKGNWKNLNRIQSKTMKFEIMK